MNNWVSYDPNQEPIVTEKMLDIATASGKSLAFVFCYEDFQDTKCENGTFFVCCVNSLPRIGEKIKLENGALCVVKDIHHDQRSLKNKGKIQAILLVPHILAEFVANVDEELKNDT